MHLQDLELYQKDFALPQKEQSMLSSLHKTQLHAIHHCLDVMGESSQKYGGTSMLEELSQSHVSHTLLKMEPLQNAQVNVLMAQNSKLKNTSAERDQFLKHLLKSKFSQRYFHMVQWHHH